MRCGAIVREMPRQDGRRSDERKAAACELCGTCRGAASRGGHGVQIWSSSGLALLWQKYDFRIPKTQFP